MRRLASLKRSIAPSSGMDAKPSAEEPLSRPNAAQRDAKGVGLDGGAAAAAQSAMLASLPTAVTFPLGAVALLAPQLQSRISTSLTDVTTSSTISMSSSSASIPLRPRGRADMDLTGRCAIIANEEDRYDHSGEGVA
jgi:hypothetical protein